MEGFKYSEEIQQSNDNEDVMLIPDLSHKTHHWVYAQSSAECLSENKPYFIVNIVELAKDASVALGISSESYLDSEDIDDEETPHAKKKQFAMAYFSDDGSIANKARHGAAEVVATYKKGDSVGLLLEYVDKKRALVSFLKNEEIVFRQWMKKDILLPTINVWWGPAELHVNWTIQESPQFDMENLSQWSMPDIVTVDDDIFHMKSASGPAALQSPCPFTEDTYYEITLHNMGEDVELGPVIGLTSAFIQDIELPGKTTGAIGYSAVNGAIMCETKNSAQELGNQGKCKSGDVVGLGLIFANKNIIDKRLEQPVVVYFTRNGEVLSHKNLDQPSGGFYATIGLAASGSIVQVNMKATSPNIPEEAAWIEQSLKPTTLLQMYMEIEIPSYEDKVHEEGETQGHFRYHPLIGAPNDGRMLRPKANFLSNGKMIQLQTTLTPDKPCFTIKIIHADDKSVLSMGVSRAKQTVGTMPGLLVGTAGYYSNGKIKQNGVGSCKTSEYSTDDVIGCCVEYFNNKQVLCFTKNEQLVGTAQISGSDEDLFPCVAFLGEPCTVDVSWPASTPMVPQFNQIHLSNWIKSPGILLDDRKIYIDKKTRQLRPLCIRSPCPLSYDWRYFEVRVDGGILPSFDQELIKAPVVSLTNDMSNRIHKELVRDKDARYIRFGFRNKSFYWREELELLQNDMSKDRTFEIQSYLKNGDTIGFGILYSNEMKPTDDRCEQPVIAYCCLNGSVVFHKPVLQPHGGFYPAVVLYRKGDMMTIDHMHEPPEAQLSSDWINELNSWTQEVMSIKKSQEPKLTNEDRKGREAEAVNRPMNHLNAFNVYINCDKPRYSEMTHIQAGLDKLGFQTSILDKSILNQNDTDIKIKTAVQSSDAVVFCLGPEVVDSIHVNLLVQQAKNFGKPVVPVSLESLKWPPDGPAGDQLKLLTMHKIDVSELHYEWCIEQISKMLQDLIGKGFNGIEINVKDGKAANMFYTDAQSGDKTDNKPSDPNAFKRAVQDVDLMNATSLGNSGISVEPIESASSNQQNKSKACVIL